MLTIEDILKPFPKGSAALALRVIEQDLTARFHVKIENDISLECFKEGSDYYIYGKVPSEGNPDSNIKVYYDVIIRFIRPTKSDEADPSIRNYFAEVFSNNPSFMFTFTHVLREKKGLLTTIDDKYYNKIAIKDRASVRNPLKLSGIDKTVWFTMYYAEKKGLLKKSKFDESTTKVDLKTFIKNIKTQEDKLTEVERRNQFRHKELINRRREEKETKSSINNKQKDNSEEKKESVLKADTKANMTSSTKANMKSDMKSGTKANMKSNTKSNMKTNMKSSLSKK